MYLLLSLFLFIQFSQARRCQSDRECKELDTFCNGSYRCNLTNRCELSDKEYNPCLAIQARIAQFRMLNPNYSISILCVEPIKACIEVYYCLSDADCCNENEQCVDGQCYAAANRSDLCQKTSMAQLVGSASVSAAFVFTLVGIFAVVGSIAVYILLIFICQWQSVY